MSPLASLATRHWHRHDYGDGWIALAVIAAAVVIGLAICAATDIDGTRHAWRRRRARRLRRTERAPTCDLPRAVARARLNEGRR